MAENMLDISGFAGAIWEKDMILLQKTRPNIFGNFRVRGVPPGVKVVKIPTSATGAANAFTPGAGNKVTLETGTSSSIVLTLDKYFEKSVLIDDFEEMQAELDVRKPYVELMTNALMQAVDTATLDLCAAYPSLPAAQKYTSAAEVAATDIAIAAEFKIGLTTAVNKLQTLLGVNGATNRFCLVDSYIYNAVVSGDAKQSPERTDLVFGASAGLANPMIGTRLINAGKTSRVYSAYDTPILRLSATWPALLQSPWAFRRSPVSKWPVWPSTSLGCFRLTSASASRKPWAPSSTRSTSRSMATSLKPNQ